MQGGEEATRFNVTHRHSPGVWGRILRSAQDDKAGVWPLFAHSERERRIRNPSPMPQSRQEEELRQRQTFGGGDGGECTVNAHFVGLGVDLDARRASLRTMSRLPIARQLRTASTAAQAEARAMPRSWAAPQTKVRQVLSITAG